MSDRTAATTVTHKRTVLVVDDNQGLADLYANWLEDQYTVYVSYSGSNALKTLTPDIDVVLLDRHMPGMSGDEVLTEIRKRNLPCQVAIVTAVEPDLEILEMRFDDYIIKPVSGDQLRDVVDSLLARLQYDTRIQELFSLMSKRQVLEAGTSETNLATQDEYTTLVDQIADLRSSLDERIQSIDDEDFRACFHTPESTQIDGESQNDQQNRIDRDGSMEDVE
jgi:two-component system response regulator AdeR